MLAYFASEPVTTKKIFYEIGVRFTEENFATLIALIFVKKAFEKVSKLRQYF
jgi:hypothetical protein